MKTLHPLLFPEAPLASQTPPPTFPAHRTSPWESSVPPPPTSPVTAHLPGRVLHTWPPPSHGSCLTDTEWSDFRPCLLKASHTHMALPWSRLCPHPAQRLCGISRRLHCTLPLPRFPPAVTPEVTSGRPVCVLAHLPENPESPVRVSQLTSALSSGSDVCSWPVSPCADLLGASTAATAPHSVNNAFPLELRPETWPPPVSHRPSHPGTCPFPLHPLRAHLPLLSPPLVLSPPPLSPLPGALLSLPRTTYSLSSLCLPFQSVFPQIHFLSPEFFVPLLLRTPFA